MPRKPAAIILFETCFMADSLILAAFSLRHRQDFMDQFDHAGLGHAVLLCAGWFFTICFPTSMAMLVSWMKIRAALAALVILVVGLDIGLLVDVLNHLSSAGSELRAGLELGAPSVGICCLIPRPARKWLALPRPELV